MKTVASSPTSSRGLQTQLTHVSLPHRRIFAWQRSDLLTAWLLDELLEVGVDEVTRHDAFDAYQVVACRLYAYLHDEVYRRCYGATHHQIGEHVFQQWRVSVSTETTSSHSLVEEARTGSFFLTEI